MVVEALLRPKWKVMVDRDAAVWLSPVRGYISLNPEPDFGSGSPLFANLKLDLNRTRL